MGRDHFQSRFLRIFGAGLFLFLPLQLKAENQKSVLKIPSVAEHAQKQNAPPEKGGIFILVFKADQPVRDFHIRLGSRSLRTNEDGFVSVEEIPGLHKLHFPGLEREVTVSVQSKSETEVIINLNEQSRDASIQKTEPTAPAIALPKLEDSEGQLLRFQVLEKNTRSPLSEVPLRVKGYSGQMLTDSEGRAYVRLPSGKHSVSIISSRHSVLLKEIEVQSFESGVTQELAFELTPRGSELEEFVVLSPQNKGSMAALVEVRRKATAVSEVLGSEQMSRQGDSDAASSLRRVTGLTLMGGKYVYVRGLGERYSAVQLNGLSLPSPEPARRVVPLDLFPASILESIVVQKSFSAQQPGEFGGGLVQLQTKSLPEKFFARISIGQQLLDESDRWTYAGSSNDWTGQDDGTRALPREIGTALSSGRRLIEKNMSFPQGFTKEELKAFGASLKKNYNLQKTSESSPPNMTLGLGNKWEQGSLKLGATSALLYNAETEISQESVASVDSPQVGKLEVTEEGQSEISGKDLKLGGMLALGSEFGKDHQIHGTLIELRHTTDEVSVQTSSGSGINDFERRRTRTEWVQRNLSIRQLTGEHRFSSESFRPFGISWRLGLSEAHRDAPDAKEYHYRKLTATDPYKLDPEVSGNLRTFSQLVDQTREQGLDFTLPIDEMPGESFQIKVGVNQIRRERKSDTFRLQYVKDYLSGQEPDLTKSPDVIFSENQNWILVNQTGMADSYKGLQTLQAQYLQTDWSFQKDWDLVLGGRNEESLQEVRTFYYYAADDAQSLGSLRTRNVLPSYSLVWKPTEKVRARWAYSETVSRPDFRELSSVRYIDDETGYEAKGNNQLKGTVITNLDQRWEYYFAPDEFVSFGVFQKDFVNPIEDVFEPMAGTLLKVPQNALSAQNRGAELEGRTSLRSLNRSLRRWSVLGNYSLIDSKVEIDPLKAANLTTKHRSLQGQSPYVVNLQLLYERPAKGLTGALLYNVIGARITEVGTDSRPDIYEQPFHQVDFVASKKWKKTNASLTFKAKNILDPEIKATQGEHTVRSSKRGRAFSVGLSIII